MEAAGVKERENALQQGNVHVDGTPWVTVYVDGSWSKRSYGTNYSALSGMVSIHILTFSEHSKHNTKRHIFCFIKGWYNWKIYWRTSIHCCT